MSSSPLRPVSPCSSSSRCTLGQRCGHSSAGARSGPTACCSNAVDASSAPMITNPTPDNIIKLVALAIFVLALAHTFAAKQFERLSHRYPRHGGLLHLLSE